MKDEVNSLVDRLDASDNDVFWFGAAEAATIRILEESLGQPLPPSFRVFLELTGGGGVEEAEISGIEGNNPCRERRGGVWWDTMRCRQEFGLPLAMVVVFFSSDEVCWCLDGGARRNDGECPVIAYDVFSRRPDREIAPDFLAFFREYVELRT